MRFIDIITVAKARSPFLNYSPQASRDLSLFQSMYDSFASAMVAQSVGTFDASFTASADGTTGPFTLVTSAGGLYAAVFYLQNTTQATTGNLDVNVRWTFNGGPEVINASISIALAAPNTNYYPLYSPFYADATTDITWEYVLSAVTGTAACRVKGTLIQLA